MKKRIWTVDLTILTLGVACAVLAGMLAAVKPMLLLVVVPVLAVMGLLLFWNVNALRKRMAKLLHGSGEKAQSTFASLALPVVVVSGGSIVWYNDAFSQDVLGGGDACLVPAGRVMPGLDEKKAAAKEGQPLRVSCGRHGAEKPCGRIPGRAPGGAAHRRGYIRRGA